MGGRAADRVLVVAFVGVLALPAALLVAGRGSGDGGERRPLAPAPAWPADVDALARLPAQTEAWFNDHFGLRTALVRAHRRLAVQWLGAPPAERAEGGLADAALGNLSRKVLVGRDGWLFLSGRGRLESWRRVRAFTPEDLDGLARLLAARRDWCAARGIAYVFVVAPDKHSVYPEHMPASLVPLRPESQLDQLVRHLDGTADGPLLDLRPALRAAKALGAVYPRTDTHWSDLGAWAATDAILARLRPRFPALAPPPLASYERREQDGPGGDLAGLLGLADVLREPTVRLVPARPRRAVVVERHPESACPEAVWRVTEVADPALPTALVFHDSFAFALTRFLAEHFRRAAWHLYRPFDPALVERERPDVVIDELAERSLVSLQRKRPGEGALALPVAFDR